MIAEVFGAAHVAANPHERGKTIGFLIDWAARKMQSKGSPKTVDGAPATAGKPPPPSKAFAEFKQLVEIMLN